MRQALLDFEIGLANRREEIAIVLVFSAGGETPAIGSALRTASFQS
jgi:hypothetical protein